MKYGYPVETLPSGMEPHTYTWDIKFDPTNKELWTLCVEHVHRRVDSDQPIMESDLSNTDVRLSGVNFAFPGIKFSL